MDIYVDHNGTQCLLADYSGDGANLEWVVRYLVATFGGTGSDTMTLHPGDFVRSVEAAKTVLFFGGQHRLISDVWICNAGPRVSTGKAPPAAK